MKKFLTLLLSLSLVLMMFGSVTMAEDEIIIGACTSTSTSQSTMAQIRGYEAVAEAIGARFIRETYTAFSPEEQMASVERLLAAGADGIMLVPASESLMMAIYSMCEEAGVYYEFLMRDITDPDLKELIEAGQYYVGCTYGDNFQGAYNMTQALIDSGSKNIAILGFPKGDSVGDTFDAGCLQAIEDNGCTFITEARDFGSAADMTNAVTSILTTHPETDGIILLGGVPHEGILPATATAIENMGMTGKVRIAMNDYVDGMAEYLDNGTLIYVFGGNQVFESQLAFVNLANCVVGSPLTDEIDLTITHNYLTIVSSQQLENYMTFVEGDIPPYTAEEIRDTMIRANNPDFDGEDLKAMLLNMSIDEVAARHANLL